MNEDLTKRQEQVLRFVREYILSHGYPPSVREIAKNMRMKSPRGAAKHLSALEQKGHLQRVAGMNRGITLPSVVYGQRVPILGRITAGLPILATENIEGYIVLDPSLAPQDKTIVLRVVGESMSGKEIHNGDLVIIRQQSGAENGDIVAALINDEATIKVFKRRGEEIHLVPANPAFSVIKVTNRESFSIIGKVIRCIKGFN